MQARLIVTAFASAALALPALAADTTSAPYAGQQTRAIKALSDEEVTSLRKGEGMGMAKAAELNGYPGPVHVLALAVQLGLTESQFRSVTAIHDRMNAGARSIGAELIVREQVLDRYFAKGEITRDRLAAETAAIGDLQGRLRTVHLAAHIETRALLTVSQIAIYERLRGYDDPVTPPHHRHG